MGESLQKVLILGGGFAGVKAALELSDSHKFEVTLLSDQANFRYYPSLFHAATGGKMAASSIPLVEIFDDKLVKIVKDSAKTLDRNKKLVKGTRGKTYNYDILIVALGVVTNYFGVKGLEKYSYSIKTQQDAQELREHIHKQLIDEQKPDVNYVVIGGGPTGVELAGALPAYINHVIKSHNLAPAKLHIDLVEAAHRLMPRMPRSYSVAIQKHLRKLGIKLYLGQSVQGETAEGLMVNGYPIESHTVIWTAGVTNHPFLEANGFVMNEHGKAVVDEQLKSEHDIYVIGDNADTPYSGMAQTALYDAVFVAKNLKRLSAGQKTNAYTPKKPVYVTPAGPRWAAVIWGKVHLYGWVGWALRSAADLAGYHDFGPWWQASRLWLDENEREKNCPVCS